MVEQNLFTYAEIGIIGIIYLETGYRTSERDIQEQGYTLSPNKI